MNLVAESDLQRIEECLATLLPGTASSDPFGDTSSDTAGSVGAREGTREGMGFFHQALRAFVLSGGKRIRPQLCLWTYDMARGEGAGFNVQGAAGVASRDALRRAVDQIACGWELFHAFLLIHDDLIDEAETRRDGLSLHRNLEDLGAVGPHAGQSLAIVGGDLLFSAAMRVFHDVDGLPPDVYRRQLRLFSRVALTTGLGQAMDIWQANVPLDNACERTLLREYHWKTAAYTFEGPMLSGAILAGADDLALAAISRYALAVGQAYQLQNDLIDLHQPAHEGCDLVQGKRTVTLLRARARMTPGKRRRFDSMLADLPGANGQAVALAEELRHEVLASGAAEQTRELVGRFLRDARDAAGEAVLDAKLSRGLRGLLESLQQQYFGRV